MPFTLSHVVAVLPLATGRPARRLVPAALVIGSMVPDLPYFVPPHLGSELTHAAYGPVTVDLVLGLAVYILWSVLLRRPLVDLAPRWLATRLTDPRRLGARDTGWVALSVVVGAYTHVLWDTFTHPHRWGTTHVVALQLVVAGLPLLKWLQYGSGAFGLLVLTGWAVRRLRCTEPVARPSLTGPRTRVLTWLVVAAVAAVAVLGSGLSAVAADRPLESVAVAVATGTISLTGAAVVVVCLAWRLRVSRRPGPSGSWPPPNGPGGGRPAGR